MKSGFLVRNLVVAALAGCAVVLLLCFFLAGLITGFAGRLPSVNDLKSYNPGLVTRVYDIDDNLYTSFFQERREIVPLENIPPRLIEAVVAVEDARFFSHRGIDPGGIMRAMGKNILAGGVVQGGSTISQQVARAVFLSPEKKVTRKLKEAILAWRLERQFTKQDILWLYLNHIYFGHGAYGVESAARTYFGKHVSRLTLAECALLAGLPKAPTHYSPVNRPEAARARQRLVLSRMVEEGYITPAEVEAALGEPPPTGLAAERSAPSSYFAEHVRRYLENQYGSDLLYRGGLRVYTTIDPRLQAAAEKAVAAGVREVDHRRGYRGAEETIYLARPSALEEWIKGREDWPRSVVAGGIYPGVVLSVQDPKRAVVRVAGVEGTMPLKSMEWVNGLYGKVPEAVDRVVQPGQVVRVKVESVGDLGRPLLALEQEPEVQGALVSMNPHNGQVLAMVGGYDFNRNQFNRAVQSRRQPGSAFKPFIYAAAIEQGYSPADIIIDSPIVFKQLDEEMKLKKWKPSNFDEQFSGPIRLREALNQSRNLPTIKLLQKIGLRPVLELAERLEIRSPLARDLSLALGSSGVTLLELTAAYGVFANEGILSPPLFIRYITDRRGTLLEVHQPSPRRVMEGDSAFVIGSMLQTVVEEGTGRIVKALNRPAGGKTGTTNDYIDAWFMGYVPQLVTGVWVGLDEEKTIGRLETGSRAAAPVWLDFMREAVRDLPVEVFAIPPSVTFVKVDAETGLLAAPGSRQTIFEIFRRGDEPTAAANPGARSATDLLRSEMGQ